MKVPILVEFLVTIKNYNRCEKTENFNRKYRYQKFNLNSSERLPIAVSLTSLFLLDILPP